jgi:hypothetical protein
MSQKIVKISNDFMGILYKIDEIAYKIANKIF